MRGDRFGPRCGVRWKYGSQNRPQLNLPVLTAVRHSASPAFINQRNHAVGATYHSGNSIGMKRVGGAIGEGASVVAQLHFYLEAQNSLEARGSS